MRRVHAALFTAQTQDVVSMLVDLIRRAEHSGNEVNERLMLLSTQLYDDDDDAAVSVFCV